MKESVFLPESTLRNVDDYISSQMFGVTAPLPHLAKGTKHVPKFAVDGHGRWREVKQPNDEDKNQDQGRYQIYYELLKGRNKLNASGRSFSLAGDRSSLGSRSSAGVNLSEPSHPNQSLGCSRQATRQSFESYKHLSTSLRSNVLPGLGKEKWESSSKTTFVPKRIPSPWQQEVEDFGVKKDAYMKWAEHDVYRQRLMKAWDKYISEAPKAERQAPVKKPTKEDRSSKSSKENGAKKKTKEKKEARKSKKQEENPAKPELNEAQPLRIEVKPANPDDDFWDFYEKPFVEK